MWAFKNLVSRQQCDVKLASFWKMLPTGVSEGGTEYLAFLNIAEIFSRFKVKWPRRKVHGSSGHIWFFKCFSPSSKVCLRSFLLLVGEKGRISLQQPGSSHFTADDQNLHKQNTRSIIDPAVLLVRKQPQIWITLMFYCPSKAFWPSSLFWEVNKNLQNLTQDMLL